MKHKQLVCTWRSVLFLLLLLLYCNEFIWKYILNFQFFVHLFHSLCPFVLKGPFNWLFLIQNQKLHRMIQQKIPQSELGSIQGSSSTKSRLQPKVVFHRRSFSTKGPLSTKVIFHRKSSSTEGCLPPKVFFHQRSSSNRGGLPLKVVFH